MTTYGLIHGAMGSGAGWAPLVAELERRGHRAVAPDLPIEDREAVFSDYAAVVADALGDAEDVVLVAHSMGGATLPLVAAQRPARAMVFVAALIPQPGRTLADLFEAEPMLVPGSDASHVRGDDGLRRWGDAAVAARTLFGDLEPEAAREQVALLRGQSVKPYFEPCPLAALPDRPCTYVVCAADRVVSPAWGRAAAERLLGVEAAELPGSHSPQVARPAALADLLP